MDRGHHQLCGLPTGGEAYWSGCAGQVSNERQTISRFFWVYEHEEDAAKAAAELERAKPELLQKMKENMPYAPKDTRTKDLEVVRNGRIVILAAHGVLDRG